MLVQVQEEGEAAKAERRMRQRMWQLQEEVWPTRPLALNEEAKRPGLKGVRARMMSSLLREWEKEKGECQVSCLAGPLA